VSEPTSAGVEIDGRKLRELRKLRGETLATFADQCGISLQYLSQLETGARERMSPPTYARVCEVLGLDDRRELLKVAA
jgi:transcriptional regulator with XRE-family HTH domain